MLLPRSFRQGPVKVSSLRRSYPSSTAQCRYQKILRRSWGAMGSTAQLFPPLMNVRKFRNVRKKRNFVNGHMTELGAVRRRSQPLCTLNWVYPKSPRRWSSSPCTNMFPPLYQHETYGNISKLSKAIRERHNTGPRSVEDIQISIVIIIINFNGYESLFFPIHIGPERGLRIY